MNVIRRLLPYLKPYRLRLFEACLAMGAVALFNGMSVYVLKPIVDEVFISRDYWMLWAAIIALPVIVGLKTCAAYIQN